MPLFLAPQGETMQVLKISADAKLCRHLEDLGIVPNCDITLLSSESGSMIVRVHDTRLALDRNIARSIMVRQKSVA